MHHRFHEFNVKLNLIPISMFFERFHEFLLKVGIPAFFDDFTKFLKN